jgi:hypothetical protein
MNAPAMTLALALREGTARIATFGFSDLESQKAVTLRIELNARRHELADQPQSHDSLDADRSNAVG